MTTLYGFGPHFDLPSPSPYVMKTEIQLQMLGVEFERAFADLDSVSKHKAPYVEDDGSIIQDSNFIRAHFEKKLGKRLDDGLSQSDKAASWALERMVEDHMAKAITMARWLDDDNFNKGPIAFFMAVPEEARKGVTDGVRESIRQSLYDVGFGRHSEEERLQLVERDIAAIAHQLGDKPYLFGDEPSVADAACAAGLASCGTPFFDTPLVGMVAAHATLPAYVKRMTERYFTENNWPKPPGQ